MCGSGRIAGTMKIRILRFCAAALGAIEVVIAVVPTVSTADRMAGATLSVFVAPGLKL